jgi:hypothetical protein
MEARQKWAAENRSVEPVDKLAKMNQLIQYNVTTSKQQYYQD